MNQIKIAKPFLLFSFILIMLMFACDKDGGGNNPVDEDPENFLLLEIEYENYAWGSQLSSRFINDAGEEKFFTQSGVQINFDFWNRPDDMGYISEEALLENYNRADSLVGQISAGSLSQLSEALRNY